MAYVLHLKTPLRQGQTLHHFIALQFEKDYDIKVTLNLSPEQLKEQYDDRLQPELSGPLYDVLSKLFKELIKINILIPGDFKSSKNEEAIKCSFRASDGYLYPLKSSLIFIHKPVIYMKHSEIKFVEFSRIGQQAAGATNRSFDMIVTKMDEGPITFNGIDRSEYKVITNYLKSKQIKIRTVDVDNNQQLDLSEDEEDLKDEEDEIDEKKVVGGRVRRAAAVKPTDMLDEYDSEEDDEDFEDEGSEGDDEEGEEEMDEDDDDVSMVDEGIDDEELKELNKNIPVVSGKRRGAGGKDETKKRDKKKKKEGSKKK